MRLRSTKIAYTIFLCTSILYFTFLEESRMNKSNVIFLFTMSQLEISEFFFKWTNIPSSPFENCVRDTDDAVESTVKVNYCRGTRTTSQIAFLQCFLHATYFSSANLFPRISVGTENQHQTLMSKIADNFTLRKIARTPSKPNWDEQISRWALGAVERAEAR